MLNIAKQHKKAQTHSRRIFIYKLILLYAALLTLIMFIFSTIYPYIKKLQTPNNIKKTLLNRMEKASLMVSPKIVSYKNGKELYSIKASETTQDYKNSDLLHLKNIDAKFTISDKAILYLKSDNGNFYTKNKYLLIPGQIKLKLVNDGKKTNMLLPNAQIYITENKLISKGKISLDNDKINLIANGLIITQRGNNILFTDKVFTYLKQTNENINIMAEQLEIKRLSQELLWHDKVVVHKGADLLKSNKLTATYSKNLHNYLKNIKATGNVYLKQKGEEALACEMYYDAQTDISTLKKCPNKPQTTIFFEDEKKL